MSKISDILKTRNLQEPPEIAFIKKYVRDKYGSDCSVTVKDSSIVIAVPSSALAGTLRHDLLDIARIIKTNKRLIIRVG